MRNIAYDSSLSVTGLKFAKPCVASVSKLMPGSENELYLPFLITSCLGVVVYLVYNVVCLFVFLFYCCHVCG